MADSTIASPKDISSPPRIQSSHAASQTASSTRVSAASTFSVPVNKSFSFLLRTDIYHPLSQLEVPSAFRSEFPVLPPNPSLQSTLSILDALLNDGHFLPAAHFSALILTSPIISANDHVTIFSLFYTRLACLELCGNTLLAAQEAKALEDLSSAFYYLDSDATGDRSHHIVPWPLRVLAVRLQSIGFGDARRGIAGLYELSLEARKQILRPEIGYEEKNMWKERLNDLGVRVVNTLIEMGDLEAARRSLANMNTPLENDLAVMRMALLHLRIGDLEAARLLLETSPRAGGGILGPLLSMAEGRFADAVTEWRSLGESHLGKENETVITQNLAVCLLYIGKLNESKEILESLIGNNKSFQSLTFNLATIYELCSENSGNLKVGLTEQISKQPPSRDINWERPNANFKITN
ncbi:conserved hypothetical protein [Uncinocarpus reesii 1704]|uniref:Trafficking protein particle complex subunit 12 n=1 Tax=Uncinocarpus reesii (strain UAMH 1704) TaxID=336963 RepID=C4JYX1_UNCRE|nr:uncharacterized protein UREG_07372 [Uncinocarpus reesii 1704]EEP82507.1 conserved hypothetical protein [Uncinocarpus reesii 1704]